VLLDLAQQTRFTDSDESTEYSNEALVESRRIQDADREAQALKWLGMASEGKGEYVNAMDFYNQSLLKFTEVQNLDGVSNILNNLGAVYNTQGNDAKALENFLASLQTAEQIGDPLRIGTALLNVGSVYMKKTQTVPSAIESLTAAIPYFEQADYSVGTGVAYINLGETYLKQNELDSAVYYLGKSREIFLNTPGFLSYALNLIGEAQTLLGDYQSAIATQRRALEIGEQTSNKLQEAHAYKGLGNTYLAQGSYDVAINNYVRAESIYMDMGAKDGLQNVYKGLANCYEKLHNYNRAFAYQTLYGNYKDTLYNIATSDELKHLQFGYDLANKEAEITLLNKENDLQQVQIQKATLFRNFSIALVIFFFILATGVVVQYRIQKKSNQRKQDLDQQQKLNKQLQQIDKLKDQFLANTSHELRTPLNGIIGLADSLIDGVAGQLSEKAIFNIDMIASSGRRLANLVNDILDFSKLKSHDLNLQLRPLDVHTIVDVTLKLSAPLIGGKPIDLINDISQDVPLIRADENRIQQILHNLIGNAIKFTEEGSVRIQAEIENQYLAISISDTGIGIPANKFKIIFESFEQGDGSTAREFGGAGLGLSVSKSLVELHGGRIDVESEIGVGSKFTFTIPLSDSDRTEFDADQVTEKVIAGIDLAEMLQEEVEVPIVRADLIAPSLKVINGERIQVLVVDDEPVNRQVLENHLSVAGYEVTQASDGNQALQLLNNGKSYDLVLLDIMMPRMNGYEVCSTLRENYSPSELPVVMLTAKNQVSDLVDGFSAGANDYLTKPFAKDELLSRIKTQLNLKEINKASAKFVPSEFLRVLGKETITDIRLGDYDEQEVTVLFTDIRSYTTLAEKMSPEDNFRFVCGYNQRMGPIIRENHGFVNQYYGDGIMAIFSGTRGGAVRASIGMQTEIQAYNAVRAKDGRKPIQVGMGMHTGALIMGIIGYGEQLAPATISDTVNTASRIESLTKHFGANILLSESTMNAIGDKSGLHFRKMGLVQMKGKKKAVRVYECFDGDIPEMRDLKLKTMQAFNDAIDFYFKKDFKGAKSAFEFILSDNPKDRPAKGLLSKATEHLKNGVPDNWTGVEEMLRK